MLKVSRILTATQNELITPSVKYRQLGDGAWLVRIEYTPEHIFIHSNKKRQVLEKIVKDRYGPAKFI
jgi:hypothetical protein